MRKIDLDEVLEIATQRYVESKIKKGVISEYSAPETIPDRLPSDQINALAEALVEVINDSLDSVYTDIQIASEDIEPRTFGMGD